MCDRTLAMSSGDVESLAKIKEKGVGPGESEEEAN
jgi:hypothetical protein